VTDQTSNRMVYINEQGKAQCIVLKSEATIPVEFGDVLKEVCADMELALACIDLWGCIPLPVAKSILRNIEPAHAAIDMAIRCSPQKEKVN
jgi:hypothetical protein